MGLLERCQELFKTSSLYEVLGIDKEANKAAIKKSYYKVSLKVHPDRAPDDPLATEKFQVLGKVYAVLGDKDQRAVYDEQGIVDEECDVLSQDQSWEDHWRGLFPKITVRDIIEFEKKYKGTEEERQDLLKLYVQHEGDMNSITSSILCGTIEDEPRLCSIIQEAIKNGEVEDFPAFTQESEKKKKARRKRADKEEEEAAEMRDEMGLGEHNDSLVMMLQQKQKSRQQNFNSFLSDLESKYGKKSKKSPRGRKGKK